jgi:hypothetical protein
MYISLHYILSGCSIVRILLNRMLKNRQLKGFVINDGVTSETREHVEAGYHRIIALLPFEPAEILRQDDLQAKSDYDEARQAPFNKSINVFDVGVPP